MSIGKHAPTEGDERLAAIIREQGRRIARLERLLAAPANWTPVTYANDWQDYGSAVYDGVRYSMRNGFTYIEGAAESTTAPTSNEVIFTLPPELAPASRKTLMVRTLSLALGYVDVWDTGEVKWRGGNEGFVYFNNRMAVII